MNRQVKHNLWALHDFTQNTLVLAEQMKEDPDVLTRIAEIVSIYKQIVNPILPDPNDPATFIPVIGDEKGEIGMESPSIP